MSGHRVCITNSIPDLRSCTVRGEHLSHCDGHGRRYDAGAGRTVITDDECTGCVPRPAEVGQLCYDHVTKLDAALSAVTELTTFLWEDRSNGIRDTNSGGGASAGGPRWPLAESRLRAQWIAATMSNAAAILDGLELDAYWVVTCTDGTSTKWLARAGRVIDLTYLDGRSVLPLGAGTRTITRIVRALATKLDGQRDELIATPRGAEAAIRATAIVQAAYAAFPLEEAEHRIVGVRCPNCQQARLSWRPPLMHRDDVVITCRSCGHLERQEYLEQYADTMQIKPARATA